MTQARNTQTDDSEPLRRLAFHTAWSLTRDFHLAEDITQEVLVKMLDADIPDGDEGRAFVSRMTVNAGLNALRSRQRQEARESQHRQESSSEHTDELVHGEELAAVRTHLMELEDRLRIPLVLRYFNGFQLKDIAEAVEAPLSTVKTRIDRGLAMMSEALTRQGYAAMIPALGSQLSELPARAIAPPVAATATVAATGFFASMKAKILALVLGTAAVGALSVQWDDDPFSDARAITLHFGGPLLEQTERFESEQEIAQILGGMNVEGFTNGTHYLASPTLRLSLEKLDGTAVSLSYLDDQTLQWKEGLIHISGGLRQRLNEMLRLRRGGPIDIARHTISEPPRKTTIADLDKPWSSVTMDYSVGGRPRHAVIEDPDTLAKLRRAFVVTEQREETWTPELRHEFVSFGVFRIHLRVKTVANRRISFSFRDRTRLFSNDAGAIEIEADFAAALSASISSIEGRPIVLLKDNDELSTRLEKTATIQVAAADVDHIQFRWEVGGEFVSGSLHDPEVIAKVMADWSISAVPGSAEGWIADGNSVQLFHRFGRVTRVSFHQKDAPGSSVTSPIRSRPITIDGHGPAWVSEDWRESLNFQIREHQRTSSSEDQRAQVENIARNFPAFLDRVVNVIAYHEEDGQLFQLNLMGDSAAAVVSHFEDATIRRIEDDAWWKKHLGETRPGPNMILLVPGAVFELPLVRDKSGQVLLPGIGELNVPPDTWGEIRKTVRQEAATSKNKLRIFR